MDEDEAVQELKPRRHDGWSILVPLLSMATNITRVVASTLDTLTDIAIEHGRQVEIDKKFRVIADGNPSIGSGTVQQED